MKITQNEYKHLSEFIKANYGINLGPKKQTLVVERLQSILAEKGFSNFSDYYKYIINDSTGTEITKLINKITTNYTFFMRESEHFKYFNEYVLPYISKTAKDKDIRIWSAGCSTGEEPYTLAMIINDYFGSEKRWWDTKLLATDISEKVLSIAVKGEYENERLKLLPLNWKMNYFNQINKEKSIICDDIKKDVIFRKFNLMNDVFPFKRKFHVIFCRNVMIYFDSLTKDKLIKKFYDCIERGGYLFIGHSECLNQGSSKFRYIMPAVYRRE